MARRDHLPQGFEAIHASWETPYRAVLLTGGLILVYIVVFTILFPESTETSGGGGIHLGIEGLAQFANFLLITGLSIVNVALVASRLKYPDIDRGFRVPLVPFVPAIAVVANLVLLVNVGVIAFALGLLAEAIGVGIWFARQARGPSVERIERETPTAVAEYTTPETDYQIVVPIANPEHAPQLMRTATTLAAANDGEVLVMSAVTVPDQTPLSRGREGAEERREVLRQAMSIGEEAGVPVSGAIKIGHHAADAILNTIAQHDSDAVLVGWQGRGSRRRDVVLGSTVDRVVAEADCDVLVEKIGSETDGELESILLPSAGGPHAELATEVAAALARGTGATIRAVHVVPANASAERVAAAESQIHSMIETVPVAVDSVVLESDDVVGVLVEESVTHDLTVIGATREGFVQRLLFGAIPEAVGERSPTTVIMTKRHLDVTSRFKHSLSKLWERVSGTESPLERSG